MNLEFEWGGSVPYHKPIFFDSSTYIEKELYTRDAPWSMRTVFRPPSKDFRLRQFVPGHGHTDLTKHDL